VAAGNEYKTKQNKTKQKRNEDKTKQNKTNKTKQTKQNKTKQKQNKTQKKWRIRASIPVPLACEASDLPIDLIPQTDSALLCAGVH